MRDSDCTEHRKCLGKVDPRYEPRKDSNSADHCGGRQVENRKRSYRASPRTGIEPAECHVEDDERKGQPEDL